MIMCIQNLVLISQFIFKILKKGRNSVANLPKLELIQAVMSRMSMLPVRIKKIQSKMKALACSQDSSHFKPMGIFRFAQGQLTQ